MKGVIKLFYFTYFLGIIFLPLFYWPKAVIPYEVPKVFLFNRWVEILGVFFILSVPKLKRGKYNYQIFFLVLIFFLVTFLSSIYGFDFNKSFWGNPFRLDGLFTLWHLIALFFITAFAFNKKTIPNLFFCFIISSFFLSLYTIFDAINLYLLKNPETYNFLGVVAPSFGNPNFLAGYLAITLPFIGYLMIKRKRYIKLAWIIFIFQITAILITQSWAGVATSIVFLLLWIVKRSKFKKKLFYIVSLFFLLICFFLLYFFNQKQILDKYRGYMPEGRVRIITKGLLAFKQKPLFGWGWANFDYAFSSINWPIQYYHDVYVDKAHSNLLEVLVTTGIFGVIIYLLITLKAGQSLYLGKSKEEKTAFISFVLFLFHSQTNLISISEEAVFWILSGIAATYLSKYSFKST